MEPISATAAVGSAVAVVFGLIAWLLKKRAAAKADPVQQHRAKYEEIDQAIRSGEDGGGLDADLLELERERMRQASEAFDYSGRGDHADRERPNDDRAR